MLVLHLSIQILLGTLPRNERKLEDMVCILEHLHQYVPTMSVTETVDLPGASESVNVTLDYFHYLLFGSDIVTDQRA